MIKISNKKIMRQYSSYTTLLTQTNLERGKKILYLVLKKKPFSEKINENLGNEIEIKLEQFIINIIPKLETTEFRDSEQSLKIIILNAIIKILKEMIRNDLLKLDINDLKILDDLMKNEGIIIDDIYCKKNKKNINKGESKDKNEKNHWWNFFSDIIHK